MDSRDYPEAYLFEEGANITLERSERYARKLEAENARLREQLAAVQKDAERYRWLRDNLDNTEALEELYEYPGDAPTAEEFDAAIDEAMKENQEPFPFSAKRVTYHKEGAIGAIMPCGTMVTNVKEAYEAGQKAAPVVQPDMVLVPREATEAMLAVIRNERGAYGTGEALYADLIAAAEGKP